MRRICCMGIGITGVVVLLGAAPRLHGQRPATFIVESPTMATGEPMPRDYTPDGRNVSPPLTWRGLPPGTRQLAVILQDHGAGNPPPWVHWVIYNIPATAKGLPEGLPIDPREPMPAEIAGATQGNNGWGLAMYKGSQAGIGNTNHYHFAVYALDATLDLPPGLTRQELLEAMEGHVIGRGDLMPFYRRQPLCPPVRDGRGEAAGSRLPGGPAAPTCYREEATRGR